MPPPGKFNYARAVREWTFVQVPLVPLNEFRRAAVERGIARFSPFEDAPWETLDRENLLAPVAYALHGLWHHDQVRALESGDLIVREERGFGAWDELRAEARKRNGADLYVLYGPWQLVSLATIVDHLSAATPLMALSRGLDAFREARIEYASAPMDRERLAKVADDNRTRELLLVRVQNLFVPSVRGGQYRAGPVAGLTDDAANWAIEQRNAFDARAAADDCGVTDGELASLYDEFATRAHWIDPIVRWFHLADQARRRERQRLQGSALRALDLYDAARVIRGWHAALVGVPLPDVDELYGIDPRRAKRRLYGTDDIRGNRGALPAILENFGLYPWRVQLIAEGPSDIAMLEEILEVRFGLSFESVGIHAFPLKGADIPANAELILGAVRLYSNYYLLLFDNEGRATQMIDALVRAGHIEGISDEQRKRLLEQALAEARARAAATPEERMAALREARARASELEDEPGQAPEFHIWKQDIEADNFSVAEVCHVINTTAERLDGLASFELDTEKMVALVEAETQKPRDSRSGMASVLLEEAARQDPPFELSKPELARRLARYALDNPDKDGVERPVLDIAEHLVRLTIADRRLRGRLR